MHFGKHLLVAATSITLLTACAEGYGGSGAYGGGYGNQAGGVSKGTVGTFAGAAGGALIGSGIGSGKGKLVSVAIGTLLGAAIGNSIGTSLDKADIAYAERTTQTALETGQPGQPLPWSNPQTGVSGTVVPSGYYQTSQGEYCREYTQSIRVGGKVQQGVGKACRQPDGTWRVVS